MPGVQVADSSFETPSPSIALLSKACVRFRGMTLDNSGRRAAILKSCDQLRALLTSQSRAVTVDASQALGRIRWRAESASQEGLAAVANDLAALIGELGRQPDGNGNTIVNPERWSLDFPVRPLYGHASGHRDSPISLLIWLAHSRDDHSLLRACNH
jgi:hypothetical protein